MYVKISTFKNASFNVEFKIFHLGDGVRFSRLHIMEIYKKFMQSKNSDLYLIFVNL